MMDAMPPKLMRPRRRVGSGAGAADVAVAEAKSEALITGALRTGLSPGAASAAGDRYLDWLFEQDQETRTRLEKDMLDKLAALAEQDQRYSGQRALFLQGQVYMEKEDYSAALEAFRKLSNFAQESYLGLEGLFNTFKSRWIILEERIDDGGDQLGIPFEAFSDFSDFYLMAIQLFCLT